MMKSVASWRTPINCISPTISLYRSGWNDFFSNTRVFSIAMMLHWSPSKDGSQDTIRRVSNHV